MSRHTSNTSRPSIIDPNTSAPSPPQLCSNGSQGPSSGYNRSMNNSQSSLFRSNTYDSVSVREAPGSATRTPPSGVQSVGPSPPAPQTATGTPNNTTNNLSGLVCNVHRTTGREPSPLVGATTTVLGDKVYVFGGRKLSRTRPQLTSNLYELDLIRRHWTKLETKGDVPPPRYFHSVCALGDTKLVCYGGMSPAPPPSGQAALSQQGNSPQDPQPEVVVMSDIHIYDVGTQTWTNVPCADAPQGRYAHCAAILPSSAVFSSVSAPMSAISHNASSSNPNQGSIGVSLDGSGGAEMVVVGGQDSANHYIEQVSVFNLRSLKWTATNSLGKSCGAYRSVVAPLTSATASKIGMGDRKHSFSDLDDASDETSSGSCMLIYSNYNFLDVKLELQVRLPDGTLSEKPMRGPVSPPGLRFPNGGVIDNHFVVSGTYMTSSKQEYALWALDLRTLAWSRIDAGGSIFSNGSWNRGVLWNRRNTFVILGNRKRSLVEDYNHRRVNFSNICMVELEAFGLYENPRQTSPTSSYTSFSAPSPTANVSLVAGGRQFSRAAEELGQMALGLREIADMDFLAIGGERIPVNSRLIARRWGPYFNQLLREAVTSRDGMDTATLRSSAASHPSRNSSITITPSISTTYSAATTITQNNGFTISSVTMTGTPDTRSLPPHTRPRTLFLPHTHLTLRTLLHYLYTSSIPPSSSPLCTPQILCSLLQLARPYRIDGLLEATIERLHEVLDGRNTAAIFNAAAMAAAFSPSQHAHLSRHPTSGSTSNGAAAAPADGADLADPSAALRSLRINTSVVNSRSTASDSAPSSASTSTSASAPSAPGEREVWAGAVSGVVGLQKRGLRGLMEGRRIRERGKNPSAALRSLRINTSVVTSRSTASDFAPSSASASAPSARGKREVWAGAVSGVVGLQKRGLRGLMEGRRIRELGKSEGERRLGPGTA